MEVVVVLPCVPEITLLLAALLVLSLAACGKQGSDDTTKPDGEPKNAQEAAAMYKDLMDQENAILTENQSLWEKVFQSADKGMTTQEDGKNYGDFLLDTIESAKDKFTADELKLLRQGGEKIREIERTLAAIEAKFPDAAPKASILYLPYSRLNFRPLQPNQSAQHLFYSVLT